MNIQQFLIDLRAHGLANTIPNISDENARFLKDMIHIGGVKNLLEIGTANGYSTIHLCMALRANGGKMTSIDYSLPSYNEAVENIKQTGMDDIATLIFGNALVELPKLPKESFHMIFIDGQKKRTLDFFQLSYPLLKNGGFFVIDDVIKFREKMSSFYSFLTEEKIAHSILGIDADDGVMLIVKHSSAII
ncbi:MAG: class I SAM-dependent methyltransferase [Candidatus Gracilibacteria bacterium]|nr:class I SAM-dependent methyltransferase [Candidatus Gracilibacteria bacterium]